MADYQNMETVFTADNSQLKQAVKESSKAVEDYGRDVDKTNKNASKSTSEVSQGFKGLAVTVRSLKTAFKSLIAIKVGKYLAGAVKTSISFIERMNLFRVATGDSTAELTRFVNNMSEALGLDPSNLLKTVGTFKQLTTSIGLATAQSDIVTKSLTKAATDIASLFEITVASATEKLEAGLIGLPKPLREIGIITTNNVLQMEAYALGIQSSVRNMSEINKVGLRYLAIMRQMKNAMGDFANTIESPANQLRVMSEQIAQLGRAIGNLFVNSIARVLPYINGLIMALRVVIDTLAVLTGFKNTVFEKTAAQGSTAVGLLGDELEDTAKKAKEMLAPFDELNVLKESEAGAAGGSSIGQMDPKIMEAMKEYDNLMGSVKMKANDIRDSLLEILGFTKQINEETGEVTWTWNFDDMLKGLKKGANMAAEAWSNMNLGQRLAVVFTTGWVGWLTGKAISLLLTPFKGLFGAIAKLFATNSGSVATAAGTAFAKIGSSSVVKFLATFTSSIKTGFSVILSTLQGFTAPFFTAIQAMFAPVASIINTYVMPFIAPVIKGVEAIVAAVTSSAAVMTAVFAAIVLAIVDLWLHSEEFRNRVGQAFKAIGQHSKELWEAVKSAFTNMWNLITGWMTFLYNRFKPEIEAVISFVMYQWNMFKELVAEVVYAVLGILDGLIIFLTGVFTGDWSKAWEGIKKIFGSIWNGIVGIVEVAINSIIDGINFLTKKINETLRFETPDWMDKYLGISFSWQPNIPELSHVTLPWRAQLARGGSLPSGALFEAGEQGKAELIGNFAGKTTVMPLEDSSFVDAMGSAVYEAVSNALAGQSQAVPNVQVNIGGRRWEQTVFEAYERHKKNIGYNIAGGALSIG